MIKARHIILKLSPEDQLRLKELQAEAARCWNFIVQAAKDYYVATGKWIGKGELQLLTKRQFRLHSQTIQALTDKFDENRKSAAANRRTGNTRIQYPWREKRFSTIPFKQMAIRRSSGGTITLSLAAGQSLDTGFVPPLPVNTCEIMWRKGRYYLSWTADYPAEASAPGDKIAGVDIGEIHPVAICSEGGTGLVVSGREIRSLKRRRNKDLGWFARALARCTKGSRRWKKLIKAKGRMKGKTDRQVRDLLHQATKKAIRYCQDNGIGELVIGNPAGVEKGTKKRKCLNRRARQKVSQMETGRIKQYLKYKAEELGIKTCLVKEHGTSSNCPVCGCKNHPTGRIYRCSCGFVAHRDGKAAFMMILKKHDLPLPEAFSFRHQQAIPKYRKPACVDGADVALSSLVIAEPLLRDQLAA